MVPRMAIFFRKKRFDHQLCLSFNSLTYLRKGIPAVISMAVTLHYFFRFSFHCLTKDLFLSRVLSFAF